MKNYQAAEETMLQAMNLDSVKRKGHEDSGKKFKVLSFTEKDRCSIFLLLAKCYVKNGKQKESKALMNKAISQFSGTN
jgi:tetratricopeptide repeat protein 21B